jgi:hypothetical protein
MVRFFLTRLWAPKLGMTGDEPQAGAVVEWWRAPLIQLLRLDHLLPSVLVDQR